MEKTGHTECTQPHRQVLKHATYKTQKHPDSKTVLLQVC